MTRHHGRLLGPLPRPASRPPFLSRRSRCICFAQAASRWDSRWRSAHLAVVAVRHRRTDAEQAGWWVEALAQRVLFWWKPRISSLRQAGLPLVDATTVAAWAVHTHGFQYDRTRPVPFHRRPPPASLRQLEQRPLQHLTVVTGRPCIDPGTRDTEVGARSKQQGRGRPLPSIATSTQGRQGSVRASSARRFALEQAAKRGRRASLDKRKIDHCLDDRNHSLLSINPADQKVAGGGVVGCESRVCPPTTEHRNVANGDCFHTPDAKQIASLQYLIRCQKPMAIA